jgi:hypothetical protein
VVSNLFPTFLNSFEIDGEQPVRERVSVRSFNFLEKRRWDREQRLLSIRRRRQFGDAGYVQCGTVDIEAGDLECPVQSITVGNESTVARPRRIEYDWILRVRSPFGRVE